MSATNTTMEKYQKCVNTLSESSYYSCSKRNYFFFRSYWKDNLSLQTLKVLLSYGVTQSTFSCSKSIIETQKQFIKFVQS